MPRPVTNRKPKPYSRAVHTSARATAAKKSRLGKLTRFKDEEDEDMKDDDEVEEEDSDGDVGQKNLLLKMKLQNAEKRAKELKNNLVPTVEQFTKETSEALAAEKEEADTEIRGIMEMVREMLESDPPLDMEPVLDLIGERNKDAEAVQSLYANTIEGIGPTKDTVFAQTLELLGGQERQHKRSFMSTMKTAREVYEEGKQNLKTATDPTELIKHMKRVAAL